MAPPFRTSGNVVNASRTALSWTHPGTVQVGDICVLHISQDGNGSAITAPDANWIPLAGSPNLTSGGSRSSAWVRAIQAGEPGASSGNFTWTTADFSCAVYAYYSAGSISLSGTPTKGSTTTTSLALPALTTADPDTTVVVIEGEASVGSTHTGPGTERQDFDGGSLYDLTQTAQGSTGTETITMTVAGSAGGYVLAIKTGVLAVVEPTLPVRLSPMQVRGPNRFVEVRYAPEAVVAGGPWFVQIGQVVETDVIAGALASAKSLAIGQALATSLAQPLSHSWSRALGQPAEADISQPLSHSKVKGVGQPSEVDLSQPLSHSKRRALGQPAETDVGQPLSHARSRTLGQPAEADLSQPMTHSKVKALGQTSEADLSQALTHSKRRALGQPTEADLSQPLAHAKSKPVGEVTEADLSQPMAHAKRRTLGEVTEADLAQSIIRFTTGLGQPFETDLSQPLAHSKRRAIGQPTDTEIAQALTRLKRRNLGQPVEADIAQALAHAKSHAVLQVLESELSQALTHKKLRALGQAVEIDVAQALAVLRTKRVSVLQVFETDTPLAPVNGLYNADSEISTSNGRSTNGTPTSATQVTTDSHSGIRSWSVGSDSISDGIVFHGVDSNFGMYAVAPSSTVRGSAYVKAPAGTILGIGISERDAVQGFLRESFINFTTSGNWDRIDTGPVTVGADCFGVRLKVISNQAAVVTYNVDDVMITLGSRLFPFFTTVGNVLYPVKRRTLLAPVAETDLSQALTHKRSATLLQALEADLARPAQPAGPKKITPLQVTETDIAQALAHAKRRALGQPFETELAQTLSRLKRRALGQVTEAELAQALRGLKRRTLLQAFETELASAIKRGVNVGRAAEADSARVLLVHINRRVLVIEVAESDTAQGIFHLRPDLGTPTAGYAPGLRSGHSASISDGRVVEPGAPARGHTVGPETGRVSRISTGRPSR